MRHDRELSEWHDTVIQALIAAKYATQLGRGDDTIRLIEQALATAQQWPGPRRRHGFRRRTFLRRVVSADALLGGGL